MSDELRLEWRDLDGLLEARTAGNPKLHDQAAIEASFERFGMQAPLMLDDDGRLIVGHGRVEMLAARRSAGKAALRGIRVGADGSWLVPAIVGSGLSGSESLAYLIADNRTSEIGGWDNRMLVEMLSEVYDSDRGLDGVAFNLDELETMLAELELPSLVDDADAVPPLPATDDCWVKPGQVWTAGGHRVTCGDASDPRVVERVLGAERPTMAWTGPPFNVGLGRDGTAQQGRTLANDALPAADWEAFLRSVMPPLVDLVDGAIYIAMSSKEWPTMCRVLDESGAHWSDTIIWSKDRFVLGRADYQRGYEPIWYGWRDGASHHWCGDRDQSDVWHIPRPTRSPEHPTMKPVALVERAISNSSKRGGLIFDPFAGSGTTVIAADRLGRRCAAIELEPRYVQVALDRWRALTGRSVELSDE